MNWWLVLIYCVETTCAPTTIPHAYLSQKDCEHDGELAITYTPDDIPNGGPDSRKKQVSVKATKFQCVKSSP